MSFLVALSTHSMDKFVVQSTMTWISVCALKYTQKFMSSYLEQQENPCYWYLKQQQQKTMLLIFRPTR